MRARICPAPQAVSARQIAPAILHRVTARVQIDLHAGQGKHRNQCTVVIGIGILRIAHEIGRVGPGVIIIGAIAPGDRFADHPRAIARRPGPGAHPAIVKAVIGRCILNRVFLVQPAIEITIPRAPVRQVRHTHRLPGGQGRDRRGRGQRCRYGRAQRQRHRRCKRVGAARGRRRAATVARTQRAGQQKRGGHRHKRASARSGSRHDWHSLFRARPDAHGARWQTGSDRQPATAKVTGR